DGEPGIRRRARKSFVIYEDPAGRPVKDPDVLSRISKLAIPPAWEEVWICGDGSGHLQATGRDSRGRKQYLYHEHWTKVRDEAKFDTLPGFGDALPDIRTRVARDIAVAGLPREKVLAAAVRLLDLSRIRVGNRGYQKQNGTFGLTTLRNRHAQVNGSTVALRFRGKGGANHSIEVTDRRLARVLSQCLDLPGYDLFEYEGSDGS